VARREADMERGREGKRKGGRSKTMIALWILEREKKRKRGPEIERVTGLLSGRVGGRSGTEASVRLRGAGSYATRKGNLRL
jgi:hypothetical protein